MIIRACLTVCAICLSSAVWADDAAERKEAECSFQGELVAAVQQARLDRVRKAALTDTLLEANPDWPEGTATAIPALGEYVYGFKRRELKDIDLGETTKTQCLESWDQLQELKDNLSN